VSLPPLVVAVGLVCEVGELLGKAHVPHTDVGDDPVAVAELLDLVDDRLEGDLMLPSPPVVAVGPLEHKDPLVEELLGSYGDKSHTLVELVDGLGEVSHELGLSLHRRSYESAVSKAGEPEAALGREEGLNDTLRR